MNKYRKRRVNDCDWFEFIKPHEIKMNLINPSLNIMCVRITRNKNFARTTV